MYCIDPRDSRNFRRRDGGDAGGSKESSLAVSEACGRDSLVLSSQGQYFATTSLKTDVIFVTPKWVVAE